MKKDTEDIDRPKTGDDEDKTASFKPLTINYELYEHYLEESDLDIAQKREFLDALWSVIVGFVDLGFGTHPIQQVKSEGCGQNDTIGDFLTSNFDDVVKSNEETPKTKTSKPAKRCTNKPAEGLEP